MFQAAGAQTFESGGLKYQVTDATEWTVTLTGPADASITALDIPATVPYHRQTADNRTETITCTVTAIGANAFLQQESLKSVSMAPTVTAIGRGAFSGCAKLETVSFSDNITTIGYAAFNACVALERVDMPSALKTLDSYAFSGCSVLREAKLNAGLETIGYRAFSANHALREITFPESVTLIDEYAFEGCDVLMKVTFEGCVKSVNYRAFYECPAIRNVYGKDAESWSRMMFYHLSSNPVSVSHNLYLGGELVTDLTIPGSVEEIGTYAFYGLHSLKSLKFEDGVKKIGRNAFDFTSSLETIDLGNTLEHIDTDAFLNSGVKELNFPNSVRILGNTSFEKCTRLERIDWGSGIETVGTDAFAYCSALSDVNVSDLSAWCNVDFQRGGNPLNNADKFMLNGEEVVSLVLPDDVTGIKRYAFEGGANFLSVTVPDNITQLGFYSFSNCKLLACLNIGTGLKLLNDNSFTGCTALRKLHIADGASPVSIVWNPHWTAPINFKEVYLGRDFSVSGSLGSDVQLLTFGPQVTDAQANDYTKYTGLLMITDLSSTPPELYEFTDEQYANVVVKVPEGAVDAYRAADYWKKFALVTDSPDYDVENISIAFDADSYTIFPSAFKASDLSYTVTPEIFQSLPVEYLSSDETLLTFSGLKPETHGYGDVTVTARLLANGATATAEAKTYAAPESIALTCGEELTLHVGETYQFEVTAEPSPIVPEMLSWYSYSSSWLKVDENGLASALKKGSNIKVRVSTYNSKRAECLVNIVDAETGIGEVEAVAPDAVYDVYTPAGALLLREAGTSRLESLPRGIYILRNADTTVKYVR